MGIQPYDKAIREFLLRHIAKGSRVIDVGCGTGWTALILAGAKKNCRVESTASQLIIARAIHCQK